MRGRKLELQKTNALRREEYLNENAVRNGIKKMKLRVFLKISMVLFAEINSEIIHNQNLGLHVSRESAAFGDLD